MLHAVLDVANRPAETNRKRCDQELLRVELGLTAEGAADIGRDHANVALPEPEYRGQHRPQDVGKLGRAPHRQATVGMLGDRARVSIGMAAYRWVV